MRQEIIDILRKYGACGKLKDNASTKDLVDLMFSPQGEEFCMNTKLPTRDMFDDFKDIEDYGVYVDRSNVASKGQHSLCFVGGDNVITCEGVKAVYKIYLFHGAKMKVIAKDYSVVKIVKVTDDCDVRVEKDKTAIVL